MRDNLAKSTEGSHPYSRSNLKLKQIHCIVWLVWSDRLHRATRFLWTEKSREGNAVTPPHEYKIQIWIAQNVILCSAYERLKWNTVKPFDIWRHLRAEIAEMRSSKRELMYRELNKNRIGAIGMMYLNFGFLQIRQLVGSLWYTV